VAPYNDIAAVETIFDRQRHEIAAVIIEPVAANMGVVPPAEGFLERLRELCRDVGALLVFDEVVTGFRVGIGGYQALCRVTPDLTCLGKIVGGGLPVGAYGGRREIMSMVAPSGPVYQAGTLSGNPLAMAAGLATLRLLQTHGFYDALEEKAALLAAGLEKAALRAEAPLTLNRVGSMMTPFFTSDPVTDYATAKASDSGRFASFFQGLLERGVYWPPSQFEAAFVSASHSQADIEESIAAAEAALER
jgi:glutamate-1-semialdehyde 2,1-aminomutase